jgi:hypothetical protein
VKTGWSASEEWTNSAESSVEGKGSKRAVLPMKMMGNKKGFIQTGLEVTQLSA